MKIIKNIIAFALSIFIIFANSNANLIKAADYTYTVTFYSGNQADFSNASAIQIPSTATIASSSTEKIVVSGLKYGDTVSCSGQDAVTLGDDSKYYVKGIRLSGRDNNTVSYSTFSIYEDQDYVVAYGIKGEMVQYTVNYFDEDGNSLADSRTYYGNVGDEPVIAYLYIEGYTPNSYNLTKPLESDATANVFTFVYTKNATTTTTTDEDADNTDNTDNTANNGDTNTANANGNNADGNNANTADNTAGGAAANADNNANNGDDIGNPVETDNNNDDDSVEPAPQNTIEDEDTPESAGGKDKVIQDSKIALSDLLFEDGLIFPVILIFVTVIALVVTIVILIKNKNKKSKITKAAKPKNDENLDKEN